MELRVLGPLEVRHDGSAVSVRGFKPRQLLALLTIRANRPVAAEQLIDELWEGEPPSSASAALRVYVGKLRRVLELERELNAPSARLPLGPHGYLLRVEPDELDADRFERLVVLAREANAAGDPAAAVPHLTRALDLWRGPALVDVTDLSAARSEIARLGELRVVAVEELSDARLALGEHALVVDLLISTIETFPLRERLTSNLMQALYRCDRQADALRAYSDLAARLDEELGVAPSPELRRLEQHVLLQSATLDFAPARQRDTSPLPRRTARPRVVGRRGELARLLAIDEAPGPPASRLVVIAGAAGIGKSTLLGEYQRRIEDQGMPMLVGGCDVESTGSYEPFVEILRDLIASLDPPQRSQVSGPLGALIPELVADPFATADRGQRDGAQYRLFEAFAAALALSSSSRVIIAIENLHWADRPTFALLRHLLRHPRLDLVVIATVREDELTDTRAELIDQLTPAKQTEWLRLVGFTDNEVRALVRAEAPPETLHALLDLTPALQDITGGNPFFLRELLRELDEQAVKLEDIHEVSDALTAAAPAGVRALIERRMERLTPSGLAMVSAAATVGRTSTMALLSAVSELPTDEALDAVEQCLAARLLIEDAHAVDGYMFSHVLVRNAVYAAIEPAARTAAHRRAALTLARGIDADMTPRNATELAHHFFEAASLGLEVEAAEHAERAGIEAAGRFAYSDAARWFERAVALHEQAGTATAEIGPLLLDLARNHVHNRQLDRARETYLAAAESARSADDFALLADIALAADGPWTGSDFEPIALSLLEEALPGIGAVDTNRRVRILNGIASGLYYRDQEREGVVAHQALDLAEAAGDASMRAEAMLAVHRWQTHEPGARADRLATALAAGALTRPDAQTGEIYLRIRRALLADLLENGNVTGFDEYLDEYEHDATALGSPHDIYWAAVMRATQATLRGDLVAADQLTRGALLRGEELDQHAGGAHLLQRLVLRFEQRRLNEELSVLRQVARAGSVWRVGGAIAALAFSETGRIEQAVEIAQETIGHDGSLLARDVFWLAGMALVAEVAATARHRDLVPLVRELIAPYADHVVVFGAGAAVVGTGHHWLGRLATAAGDREATRAHFGEAIAISKQIGAPYWEAQATVDLARALSADRSSDRQEVQRLLGEAAAIARPGGYTRVLDLATTLG